MASEKKFFHRISDTSGIAQRAAFTGVEHGVNINSNAFLKLAATRFSCRSFQKKAVSKANINAILEAARLAPSATNRQPVHVWVIKSENAREKLKEATPYTFDAPVVFAVGCRPEDAWVRKYDGKNSAEVDAAIVGTHIMLEASDLGLGSTWVGSFDPEKLSSLFPEMDGWVPVALFPVGHPAGGPGERHSERKSMEEMVGEI